MSSKIKLMIVDDDEDLQNLLSFVLKKHEMEIFCYTNPMEALIELDKIAPNIILTDFMLPEINGIAFVEKAQEIIQKHQIKLLMGSGRALNDEQMEQIEKLNIRFIQKPYDLKTIPQQIRSAL